MGIRNMKLGSGKGKTENKLHRTRDLGFISYDYYDFTFYNLQLWAAAKHRRIRRSRQTDIHYGNLTPATQRHYCHLWQNRTHNIARGVLDVAYQHLTGLQHFTGPLHISRHTV